MARHRRVAVPRSVFAERILKYLDLYGVMAGTRRLISSIELCRKIVAPCHEHMEFLSTAFETDQRDIVSLELQFAAAQGPQPGEFPKFRPAAQFPYC